MKRVGIFIAVVSVPLCLFFAIWQSYTTWQVKQRVDQLEKDQSDQIEVNKRLIAQYAAESSPGVIAERAKTELGMDWPGRDQIIRIEVPASSDVVKEAQP